MNLLWQAGEGLEALAHREKTGAGKPRGEGGSFACDE